MKYDVHNFNNQSFPLENLVKNYAYLVKLLQFTFSPVLLLKLT